MKSIKKVIAVLLILTTMTGCVKYKNTMTINNDKSMNFEGTYIINDKVIDAIKSMGSGGETTIEENINKDKLKERGITISDKKENGYTGVSFSKKYDNIDKVSNDAGKEVIISDYLDDNFDDSILFKVEKGFLKNKYTAKFSFNSEVTTDDGDLTSYAPSNNEQLAMGSGLDGNTATIPSNGTTNDKTNDKTNDNTVKAPGTNDNSTTVIDDNQGNNTGTDDDDYDKAYEELSKLANEMEFSFTVNLPSTPISNNATKTDNGGKTLVWNIESNKVTTIEFAFELKNMTNYYILYGGIAAGVIIVIVIIIMIINKGKKGKEVVPAQNEPIHADYDPSIAAAIPNPALVNGGQTTNVNNEVASTTPVTNEPTQTVQQSPVQPQTPVQIEAPAEPKVEVSEPVQEPVNGPIGNTNTEPQAHIIPEVTVEPQVVIPETEPTFVTPDNIKEEPIVIPEEKPEIKIDAPKTIDMNQN